MSVIDTDSLIDNDEVTETDDADAIDKGNAAGDEKSEGLQSKQSRSISISVRAVIVAVVIAALAAAAGTFGWLYMGAHDQLTAQAQDTANRQHAEDIAASYATNAAQMDYQDFSAWKVKLVNGTSPELKDKLTKAANSMEQVLAPLQWKSSAKPLATKVRSNAGGIYTVDSFVSVLTKTMQAPEGLQSTATYSVTIDSRNNWQITDVGGIDSALGK
ncbi:hypothetical protein ACJH6J_27530 [Mycobacterium sp. SMC-18]|uniref:hypothetical protein n=1 Tax=Mycobacterium sp. SMC-18 TaxID=3381629 RepID=UPI003876C21A